MLVLLAGVVLCRTYWVGQQTAYAASAGGQSVQTLALPRARGDFYDRTGRRLTGLSPQYYALCLPGDAGYTALFPYVPYAEQSLLYERRNLASPFLIQVDRDLTAQRITTCTVPQDIKNMFGHFAYLLESVKNLDTLCPYRMKITADGEVFDGEYLFGAISNSTSIAGLMKLSPDEVSFDDGKFEMLLVPVPRTPAAMQALILALVNKDYYDSEGLIFRHVKHVTAETAEDIPWTLDGEYDPGAPVVEIGIEENGVTMLL